MRFRVNDHPRIARMLASAAAATAFALVCSAVEWARLDIPIGGNARSVFLLVIVGLFAPLASGIGVVSGACSMLVSPQTAPTLASLQLNLRTRARGRQAAVAAFCPLAALGVFAWMVGVAYGTRALLPVETSANVLGAGIGAMALGGALVTGLIVLSLTPPLRKFLADKSQHVPQLIDPVWTLALGLMLVAGLLSLGIWTGSPAGEGHWLGIFGVLRRQELDLRFPLIALSIFSAGFFLPGYFRDRAALFATVAGLSFTLTLWSGSALRDRPQIAQLIDRSAPVARYPLKLLQRLTDRDHDGASAFYGGGDCDDHNANIYPLADDVPGNEIDEDCSGTDAKRANAVVHPSSPSEPPTEAVLPASPNLILITVDTLRADLGYAGNPRQVSPNIDQFAARSTIFERAYSLASYTGKSVGPTLIGKYGSETHRNWGHFNTFSAEDTFVAERFKRAAIRTLSAQAHRYFGAFGGLDRGFDVVDMSTAPPEGAAWDVDAMATGERLTDAAIAQLEKPENTSGRFFLWVHYLDPHADYLKHKDLPSFGNGQRDLYDGEVLYTDRQIGRLLEFVERSAFSSRTNIILTSDHGEAFGEHKMYRHGFELWEELVRVPLVIHVPTAKPSRVKVRRSLIDLVPTMLDLMKVDRPTEAVTSERAGDFVSGFSLLSDIFMTAPAKDRDVFVDMPAGPYNEARRAVIHHDQKLVVSGGARFELYDLANDPGERNDLSNTEALKEAKESYETVKARLREIKVAGPRK